MEEICRTRQDQTCDLLITNRKYIQPSHRGYDNLVFYILFNNKSYWDDEVIIMNGSLQLCYTVMSWTPSPAESEQGTPWSSAQSPNHFFLQENIFNWLLHKLMNKMAKTKCYRYKGIKNIQPDYFFITVALYPVWRSWSLSRRNNSTSSPVSNLVIWKNLTMESKVLKHLEQTLKKKMMHLSRVNFIILQNK